MWIHVHTWVSILSMVAGFIAFLGGDSATAATCLVWAALLDIRIVELKLDALARGLKDGSET